MKTIRRQFLPPHFPPTSICVHMLACALVGRTGLCSSLSILISELGSVPSYLRDTTSAIFPLSPLHQFLSQIIPLVHKHDIISLILKQKLETLFHPGSSASCASTFFNNKIAVKNCLYICLLQALFFSLEFIS